MGREVRRVTKDWQHPKDESGKYKPLRYGFAERLKEWEEGKEQWKSKEADELKMTYGEWYGEKPEIEDYMPQWTEKEKTHIQMYEDTSEGTPISPVFDNAEEMAKWLADNGASYFGSMTATYKQWLQIVVGCGSTIVVFALPWIYTP